MADVCTLIIITTMNAVACIPPTVCTKDADQNGRVFCKPDFETLCTRPPPPSYDCKRPDGTSYIWQDDGKH